MNDSDIFLSEESEIYGEEDEIFMLNAFTKNAFGIYNKTIMRAWGIETAIFLSSICQKYSYFKKRNMLTKEGYFFNTGDDIFLDCGLSKYQQSKSVLFLKKEGVLFVKKHGVPPKLHYKIAWNPFKNQFLKISKLIFKNLTYIKENKYNNNSLSKDKRTCSQKPSVFKNTVDNKKIVSKNNLLNKNIFSNKIIIIWNKQPNVSKHKKDTILKKIKELINSLRKGTFKNKHHLDKRFLKDFNIPEKLLSKKFTKQEIKKTILKMAQCHLPEFTPANKSIISKSLFEMIYHLPFKSRSKYNSTSWFFSCYVNSPKLLEEQTPELNKQEELLLQVFREEVKERKINEFKHLPEKDISYLLLKFYNFWKTKILDDKDKPPEIDFSENKYFRNGLISNKFGTSFDMLRTYFDYLEENDWIERKPYLFNPDNTHFKNFLKHESNELNFKLTNNITLNSDD